MLPPPSLVEPEHRTMLRESVAGFVAKAGLPASIRPRRKSETGFDRALWTEMAGLGWLQLALAEDQGGLGMGIADLAALLEETGKGALPEPIVAGVLGALALAEGDDGDWLAPVLAGKKIVTLAWQGRTGGISSEDVGVSAAPGADGGTRLNGEVLFVPAANAADALVVAGRTDSGIALFLVPSDAPGLSMTMRRAGDYTPFGEIVLSDVAPAAILAGPERGTVLLDRLLDIGRVAVSAELVGVMHRMLEVTLDYMRTREQFGRPIGSFQALQHRAVNLYVQLELARSAVMKAAAAIDAGNLDVPALAAGCKARAAEAAVQVAGQSIHLHGTIGFTEELDLSLLIRRAHLLSAWLGNGDASLRRYTALRWPQGVAA